ncbi:MAG: hypothetical protein LUG16_02355 [Candidatus Gastranaerophilales bacterium]|nr:hypothetical protein [Candidatus Gastranaerophilales bacterium]
MEKIVISPLTGERTVIRTTNTPDKEEKQTPEMNKRKEELEKALEGLSLGEMVRVANLYKAKYSGNTDENNQEQESVQPCDIRKKEIETLKNERNSNLLHLKENLKKDLGILSVIYDDSKDENAKKQKQEQKELLMQEYYINMSKTKQRYIDGLNSIYYNNYEQN